jgi:hypothetical protein
MPIKKAQVANKGVFYAGFTSGKTKVVSKMC